MQFYNDIERTAAEWMRELIREKHLPNGVVDERSIADIKGEELKRYRQCHFFAGIGGWAYALQLAGWPTTRPVWTGSCPCQSYSAAGKQAGDADPRNLWPEMFRLIRERRPDTIFGEQVEGAIRHGWLDGVCAGLEAEGYAVGTAVLGAHSVGAPHIRQRLYWVANARSAKRRRRADPKQSPCGIPLHTANRCEPGSLADTIGRQPCDGGLQRGGEHGQQPEDGGIGVALGDTNEPRLQGRQQRNGRAGKCVAGPAGAWSNYDLIPCRDGKARRVESGTFPLAHGVPGRVGLLRGYGNSIVPQVAATFIRAFLETEGG